LAWARRAAIQRELATRFPDYERTYARLRADLAPADKPQDKVSRILYQWPPAALQATGHDEQALQEPVTATKVLDDATLRYRIIDRGDAD
jgi:hypothetical protein